MATVPAGLTPRQQRQFVSGINFVSFKMTSDDFRKAIKAFLAQNRVNHSENVKRIGFEALRRVILRTTRVDTGRMRNAWHVSFHNPSSWEPPAIAKAKKGQAQKLSNVPRPDPGSGRNLMFLFLQNNVFYTTFHEFGTRDLSPLLMLTQTLNELRREMEKFLTDGTDIIWNKEINGVTGKGLSKAGKLNKRQFMQRLESRRQRRRSR
jgi:hypothetical protein